MGLVELYLRKINKLKLSPIFEVAVFIVWLYVYYTKYRNTYVEK